MEFNYMVVLFKNKVKQKIIKKFKTFKNAKSLLDKLNEQSQNVIFEKKIEFGKECKYEIGLIEDSKKQLFPIYLTDEMGRNVKVKLEDTGMTLSKIFLFKKEEKIFYLQLKKKIDTQTIIKKYFKGQNTKLVSSLNNKIILQIDENVFIFSLKTEPEAERFLDCLSGYFFKNKIGGSLFVKSVSSAQKKYLFELLEEKGVDKKILYRKFTTYPPSK
jgi:hypothetical protein